MDRDAVDYARTLQGEHAQKANELRRAAYNHESQAATLRGQADWQDKLARWAAEMAEALGGDEIL